MDVWGYRISVACDMIEFESSHLRWCAPLHLTFPGDVAYACTNIQQEAEEEEEEEK